MNEARVQVIASRVSAGNSDMRLLLDMVGQVARVEISKYPNTPGAEKFVARRMVVAASHLVRGRISFSQLDEKGAEYWRTAEGQKAQAKVSGYIEKLGRRARVG